MHAVAVVVPSPDPNVSLMVSRGWAVGEATSLSCSWQHLEQVHLFFVGTENPCE